MSKNNKTHRKNNKKTHRKNNKKTNRRNKTSRRIKLRFNKIGGNRTCLDELRAKYGQDVFWTGGIAIEQIYDDALNIRRPDVIQLLREVRERISKITIPNKAEMTRLICVEIKKITDMVGEESSICRNFLYLCGKFNFVLAEYNSPHYKFLLEYLDCLINIMEFSLLVEDELMQRAEPAEPAEPEARVEPAAQAEPEAQAESAARAEPEAKPSDNDTPFISFLRIGNSLVENAQQQDKMRKN